MDSIESLEELIEKLNQTEGSHHGRLIKNINVPIEEFEAYASWEDECYTRNCIFRTKKYELILLCWDKCAETKIHGHDGQNCWVYQLEGQMTEIRYDKCNLGNVKEVHRMQLNPGTLTFMNKTMGYHKLINETGGRAMSLHLYMSPITSCEVFNDQNESFDLVELEYDTNNRLVFAGVD